MPEPAGPRPALARWRVGLVGVWCGGLLAIAAIAAPAVFAALPTASAGAVVRRVFAAEAAVSVGLGVLLMLMERRLRRDGPAAAPTITAELLLPAGAVFCTVAGYYAILPMLDQARAGIGPMSFGALHAVSTVFFGLKVLLVSALLWRSTR